MSSVAQSACWGAGWTARYEGWGRQIGSGRRGSQSLNCCVTGPLCSPAVALERLCAALCGAEALPPRPSHHSLLAPAVGSSPERERPPALPPGEEGQVPRHTQTHSRPCGSSAARAPRDHLASVVTSALEARWPESHGPPGSPSLRQLGRQSRRPLRCGPWIPPPCTSEVNTHTLSFLPEQQHQATRVGWGPGLPGHPPAAA